MTKQIDPNLVVVIMAGGAGTRFWPLSTERCPKQFLRLFGERTLLQLTYDRVAALVPPERVLVLTSAAFEQLVRQQLPELPARNVVGEPMRRDTAAAVALAALICEQEFDQATMAVLTADHLIEPPALFQATLLSAARQAAASDQALYTFGIKPGYPATGFGYLERGDHLCHDNGVEHYQLLRFVEKPDLETAQGYLDTGRFYWNSGMFVWSTAAIMAELERLLPAHLERLRPAVQRLGQADFEQALRRGFEPLDKISIDFGVMERARQVRCVEASFEWNDVGGWLALEQLMERDDQGNARQGRVATVDAANNLVHCEDPHEAVALVGVKDLIVVRAGGRTLVAHRDSTEAIKQLVQGLDPDLK